MNSLYCFQLKKNYSSVWGARTIYNFADGTIEFLADRVTVLNQENFEPLKAWLKQEGIDKMRKLIQKSSLAISSSEVLAYGNETYIIKATPNGSYGYMYLVAHPINGEEPISSFAGES